MSLARSIRRLILIPRAARVARERQYRELDEFLESIRRERANQPPWKRRYADEE